MEDSKIDMIFAGNFDRLERVKHPIIRVYLSSTYTDMTMEKSILVTEVYPKVKEYCRERYGAEFQVIDMRWGVRDEATDDHQTMTICRDELRICQETSIGPNFIFLGAQKYGYCPIPAMIECSEFQMMRDILTDFERDHALLDVWFEKDINNDPPVMVLQPISKILPNFLSNLIPAKQEADQRKWYEALCQMQALFRTASDCLYRTDRMSFDAMRQYHNSVIENEITEGILKMKGNTKNTCLSFLREIKNFNIHDTRGGEERKPKFYVDFSNKQIDQKGFDAAEELREKKIPENLEPGNTFNYEVDWSALVGSNPEAYDQYVMSFIVDFYKSIIRQIDKSLKKRDNSVRGLMANEIHKHLDLCVERNEDFLGRDVDLYKVKRYICGSLRQSFLAYGPSGTGKTSFLARVAFVAASWIRNMYPFKPQIMIIRFLGITPTSSAVHTTLISICQQLCYNLEVPIEEIPTDFVPLKNYFKSLLDLASKTMFTVILLDAIEIFFVDSHQNGATSWIPKVLPENVKVIITFTKEKDDTSREKNKFINGFSDGEEDSANVTELAELGRPLGEKILKYWMEKIKRNLTNSQWRLVFNALENCSMPLFVKLIFTQIRCWKGYWLPTSTMIPAEISTIIVDTFDLAEKKFGKMVVSHAVSYITASKSGLTEAELEDILSLDERVLEELFEFYVPKVRRLPPILWRKIRRELQDDFSEREADGSRVIVWAHKQFRDVAIQKYLQDESTKNHLHIIMSDFFLGTWSNGKKKSFKITELHRQRDKKVTGRVGEADRRVPRQPNVFIGTDGKVARYNLRRFGELPFHLINAGRITDLCDHVLFNYHWLHAKISAVPIEQTLEDFTRAIRVISNYNQTLSKNSGNEEILRQMVLVLGCLRLSRTVLDKFPDMLSAQMIGRLLPEINKHEYIRKLLVQCDSEGFVHNCLVPLRHCLPSPGGPLKYSLEGHRFAIFSCCVSTDKRYVVSVSNKFVSFDISTSEICRDIDPKSDGMMMGMVITADSRFTAAFTNTNQLVIVDLMLGTFVRMEKPMADNDDINDLCICSGAKSKITGGHRVVLFNNKYFRVFDMNGQHIGEEQFSVALPSVLSLHFPMVDEKSGKKRRKKSGKKEKRGWERLEIDKTSEQEDEEKEENDPTKTYLSVHWSGDSDLEDTRIWMHTSITDPKVNNGHKTTGDLQVFNAFELVRFKMSEAVFFGCQKSGSYVQAMLEGKQVDEPKWNVVRYHHDPTGTNEAKAVTLCQEIPDDVYGLTFHQDTSYHDGGTPAKSSKLKKTIPSLLTISVVDGLLVVMDPLEEETPALKREKIQKSSSSSSTTSSLGSTKSSSSSSNESMSETGFRIKRLKFPRGVTNIRIKLNHANPCSIGWRSHQMGSKGGKGSILVMAGIRRDIFVWDLNKEEMLRSFAAHSARILQMKSLNDKTHRVFITSSLDKTIKVWDIDNILHILHPIDCHELRVDKIKVNKDANRIITLTRNGIGFWNLENGALECTVAEKPLGGYISDVELISTGKYFVTAEQGYVFIWNFSNRVILQKLPQNNVEQLMEVEVDPDSSHVAAISYQVSTKKSDEFIYRVICRNVVNGDVAYKFDVPVTQKFKVLISGDKQFFMIYGFDRQKKKSHIYIYSTKKGSFLHKVPIRYPNLKRPLNFLPYDDNFVLIVDSEKTNIIDVKNKKFDRSIRRWTGQSTQDGKFGLAAPNGGGLLYLDLTKGTLFRTLLGTFSEGVFAVHSEFSACEKYIIYYHGQRRTLMLFRRRDGKSVANYCLHTTATCFYSTPDGKKLIVGGQDGSVTILVVAQLEDEGMTNEETITKTAHYLKNLPSRRIHRDKVPKIKAVESETSIEDDDDEASSSMNTFEERMRDERRAEVRRRFRSLARVALLMDKIAKTTDSKKKKKLMKKKKQEATGCGVS